MARAPWWSGFLAVCIYTVDWAPVLRVERVLVAETGGLLRLSWTNRVAEAEAGQTMGKPFHSDAAPR